MFTSTLTGPRPTPTLPGASSRPIYGARDLNGDQWYADENLAIIEEYTGVPADVIRRANRSYHDPNGGIPVADMETLEDFFRRLGELNYEQDLDLSSLVNAGYVESALEELGGPVAWE